MREIVLDTETTGLEVEKGHRLVEICCLELDRRLPTGKVFHTLINPERDIPPEAVAIHGIDADRLKGAPLFGDIAAPLLDFIGDSRLVIHNAEFDLKFLNSRTGAHKSAAVCGGAQHRYAQPCPPPFSGLAMFAERSLPAIQSRSVRTQQTWRPN